MPRNPTPWLALLVVVAAASCANDLPPEVWGPLSEDLAASLDGVDPPAVVIQPAAPAEPSARRPAQDWRAIGGPADPPRRVDMVRSTPGQPRPASQTRVWVGIWCADVDERDGIISVEVDGVELYRALAHCDDPQGAPDTDGAPGGGSVAFTVTAGSHLLVFHAPGVTAATRRLVVNDDLWVAIDHRIHVAGTSRATLFQVGPEPLGADRSYDPRTRPRRSGTASAPGASARPDGTAENEAPEAPTSADGARATPQRTPGGRAAAPGVPEGEWLDADSAFLSVRTRAPAIVEIDGVALSRQAPFENVPVPSGAHRVTVRPVDSARAPRSFSVELARGQSRALTMPDP
ncbi:MAG: hypothetical protein H6700_02505 [Myxococcales bacterium]|nr:hypothetical protein [Myxococcales bacterium]MCB9530610.1 hypothetical protein [Myxococcales bacterium]